MYASSTVVWAAIVVLFKGPAHAIFKLSNLWLSFCFTYHLSKEEDLEEVLQALGDSLHQKAVTAEENIK